MDTFGISGTVTLKWEIADPDFLRLSEEDYARGRLVQVRLDHRRRACEVTSSGLADLTVTVAAGRIDDGGDSYWLDEDTDLTCENSDTRVYAELADGAVTPGSGTSVPDGAVLLADIAIDGNVVTVTSHPSGNPNAIQGYIVPGSWKTAQKGQHTGLELAIQQTR